jgi:hypothetical protein
MMLASGPVIAPQHITYVIDELVVDQVDIRIAVIAIENIGTARIRYINIQPTVLIVIPPCLASCLAIPVSRRDKAGRLGNVTKGRGI